MSAVASEMLVFEHETMPRTAGGRWEGLFQKVVVVISAVILIVIVCCAIFAPWVAPHNPNTIHLLDPYTGPSRSYLFGQDSAGRDILSQAHLRRPPVPARSDDRRGDRLGRWRTVGLPRCLPRRLHRRHRVPALRRHLRLPPLLLAVVIVATFGASFMTAVLAVAVTYIPLMGRLVRSAALVERSKPYVEQCRLQGYGAWRVLFVHVMPNIGRIVISQTTLYFAYGLLDLSALSFLGLGAQPPQIDWGGMLENANQGVFQSASGVVFPAVAIVLLVVSLNFIADWALDFRTRKSEQR